MSRLGVPKSTCVKLVSSSRRFRVCISTSLVQLAYTGTPVNAWSNESAGVGENVKLSLIERS